MHLKSANKTSSFKPSFKSVKWCSIPNMLRKTEEAAQQQKKHKGHNYLWSRGVGDATSKPLLDPYMDALFS